MISNSTNKTFPILILICSINLFFGTFYLLQLGRPFIYYEYLLIPLVFSFFKNYIFRFLAILLLIISDLLITLSKIYYFDAFNFLQKLNSIFISSFKLKTWLLILFSFILIILLIHLLIKKSIFSTINDSKSDKKFGFYFFVLSFVVIYCFDTVFGSSNLNYKPNGRLNYNFSQPMVTQLLQDAKIYFKKYLKVSQIQDFKNSKNSESITFKYLKNDTSDKQVLIVIESWGLDKDLRKRKKQLQKLLELGSFGYQFQLDSSLFFGGTTSAEVRELYNKSGEAYYSIVQNGYSDAISIPQLKYNKGYNTISLQSFSGYYSNGYHFRKVAGFNQIKDFSFFKNQSALNFNNHYISVNDEAVFDYGFKLISTQKRAFLYILTINSHLPFHVEGKKSELQSQSDRITEQFTQLANLLKKYPVNKLVIVGDHPPPFFTRREIDQYSTKFVPAVIITHK
jgi:hypothetical protein